VAESRVYYLLGFEASPGKRPGDWRKLKVKVRGEGLTVRARKGYTLRVAPPPAAPSHETAAEPARKLPETVERALDSVHDATDIPLRAITYVLEPRGKDTTRVVIAAEIDARGLSYEGHGKDRAARLDVAAAATLRDTGKTLFSDERVEVRVPEGEDPGWRSVVREFDLPAGVAQARLVVRDTRGGALGTLSQRLEVPRPGALRLSTPILSDQAVAATDGGAPRVALAAHRTFPPGGGIYCEIEVFGAALGADGQPHVSSGLEVRDGEGALVREAALTPIKPDAAGRVARLVGIGVEGLATGPYELVLTVQDETTGARIEDREPFTLSTAR
jgi:hypothetical protein